MGSTLGPKFILKNYMDPLGLDPFQAGSWFWTGACASHFLQRSSASDDSVRSCRVGLRA